MLNEKGKGLGMSEHEENEEQIQQRRAIPGSERWTGADWAEQLAGHPDYACFCDWSLLSGEDWQNLLKKRPEFAEHCDWSLLSGEDWQDLLKKRPVGATVSWSFVIENSDCDKLLTYECK